MFDDMLGVEAPEALLGKPAHDTMNQIDRRDLLRLGLVGILGSIVPLMSSGSAMASNYAERRISFRQAHTGESFNGVYRVGDRYLPEAFERMNYVLRDFRTREIFPMDPRVIDIISIIQSKIPGNDPLNILSGYRSPKTNAMLRRASTGVAKNSFHMYGQALDIRAQGYSTRKIQGIAKSLRAGGVGYYSKSNFVHVDTGTVRSW